MGYLRQFFLMALLMLSFSKSWSQEWGQRARFIYVGDPMCSWCYGFGGELDAFFANHPDVPVELVMGGLRAYGKESMASLSDFLRSHWKEVAQKTGVKFNEAVLSKEMLYDTEPACRAVVAFMMISKSDPLPFFKAVQKRFYLDGADLYTPLAYKDIVTQMGGSYSEFSQKFLRDARKQVTMHFSRASSLGATSFPTLLYTDGKQMYTLSNGFATRNALESAFKKINSNQNSSAAKK